MTVASVLSWMSAPPLPEALFVLNELPWIARSELLLMAPPWAWISRPARTWEFLDATGPRASILGREDGTLEAYVYPLKIVKDFRLRFQFLVNCVEGCSHALGNLLHVHVGRRCGA